VKLRVGTSVVALVLMALASAAPAAASPATPRQQGGTSPTTPIRHFIFLMQGGRTFDNYFGSYPGAAGPPVGTCQPKQAARPKAGCVKPFPLTGKQLPPLGASRTIVTNQYDHGKMNGFVSAYQLQARNGANVMGYYDRSELPFYWNAAGSYVLFDHFFSATRYGIRANRSSPAAGSTSPARIASSSSSRWADRPVAAAVTGGSRTAPH